MAKAKKTRQLLIDEQLRQEIRASGLTMSEISDRAGISGGALSRFLSDDPDIFRDLRLHTAGKVAAVLGLTLIPRRDR